ncbi:RpiR family glv operon transcriptional regulator [Clostridium acetobutylicum]|uniref:Transcriptional regulator, RpiR family n=1 Tax=Clostridium acetobutylicum (strain ATCC 824 / DSM 792 / JCM 1419 / IAM 19013 / LMG 5710 / NBRC 13948 / NRRL B-527 / VKM B-1787 / 2291 / W) TaxID=272562 RepID=Q97LM6_CLOAB|nr:MULTISPECIES: MurR/RpiR family transcriptional regulator [Clostridium]AAK78510.1 Transcriptional regulator, RpiR family [Clostridium acetobutylicum ATCC 824]ADZ19583.1 Transcriptional regulator, RpiR family [Clostridium acetobutylicum EA 2018]AEI34226.1 RpiR family transcriptional regulator [Clostridium acetobutylicum DSM 1731]AWV80232.1 MurR/RpiR family transcriptional regulator [Clostridium acetobutylicum]MBC2392417.1 MurR/RpiR family transcriptional regulator [Clostridium acetobutylicum]
MRLEELVNNNYNKLNENDLHIWKYICCNKRECCTISIDELAKKCNISRTTISRFTQKLSLEGFGEFKVRLKLELGVSNNFKSSSVEDVYQDYYKTIKDMKEKDFLEICRMIYGAKHLFVYGTGAVQIAAANELKRHFISVNKFFVTVHGEAEMNMVLETATDEDLIVIISLSGEKKSAVEYLKKVKVKNIPSISITKLSDNSIARLCDENLYIITRNIKIEGVVTCENVGQYFILIEILFLKYITYLGQLKKEDTIS